MHVKTNTGRYEDRLTSVLPFQVSMGVNRSRSYHGPGHICKLDINPLRLFPYCPNIAVTSLFPKLYHMERAQQAVARMVKSLRGRSYEVKLKARNEENDMIW